MFKCDACDTLFDTPVYLTVTDEFGEYTLGCCPSCKSDEVYRTVQCYVCKKYNANDNQGGICDKCLIDLQRKLERLIEDNFTVEQGEYINEYLCK